MTERYLVTGCAGFIASKVAELLLEAGHEVVGIDTLNDAYDPRLKHWRIEQLRSRPGFSFQRADVSDLAEMERLFETRDWERGPAVRVARQRKLPIQRRLPVRNPNPQLARPSPPW